MVSDQQVKNEFFKLESDPALFGFTLEDSSVYFMLRYQLEQIYRTQHSTRQEFFSKAISVLKKRVSKLLSRFQAKSTSQASDKKEEQIISSPFLFVSTSDWTINDHESMELVDVIKYYRRIGIPIQFVQPDFYNNQIRQQSYHDGFAHLKTELEKPFDPKVVSEVRALLSFISTKLSIDLDDYFESCLVTVNYCLSMARQLTNIIRASNARVVFGRSIYTEPWIPIACKRSDATCVEVQHGVVSTQHIYYQTTNAASQSAAILFPDYLLTLGRKWNEIFLSYHQKYNDSNTLTLGIRNMPFRKKTSGEFNVLICLQPGIFDINPIIKKLCTAYKDELHRKGIRLIVRPHPGSFLDARDYFKELIGEDVLSVENSRQVNFYSSLENADVLISLSSMCLYEALAIGIPVISFEYSRGITIPEGITFANDHHDLMEILLYQKDTYRPVRTIEYLSPFNERALDFIIEATTNNQQSHINKNITGQRVIGP